MNYAIIPARGGSKRIPRKNIKQFAGKPMIAWAIETAKKSECFEEIVVSTDDEEIAEIANKYGAITPFQRPAEIADDYSPTLPVIRHAIKWLTENNKQPDKVCCIYPTTPFLKIDDLRTGLNTLSSENCDFVVSVTQYPHPIQRALKITANEKLQMLNPQQRLTRSQDLEDYFHDAGQFYWGHSKSWCDNDQIFGDNTRAVILPSERVVDIDTPRDWERAEAMCQYLL